ncbi:hypothetical protein [Methylobacterium sp. ARG-1]|uniref:hypothetical protein n=1 Tax=Methylobacterium sp. ARG-1 TaxID=1692501 RepID=UPI0006A52AAC|nr:hypothetical protein [Methylobacterium sp. ARG-1]KNY20255.1 hypothetical protein AKJ13_23110 [Methylobacterium sp. ARG-1]
MSDVKVRSDQVAEVLTLSTTLANQILGSQAMGRPFAEGALTALVGAARFLHDNRVPWPPVVQDAIDMLAKKMEAINLQSSEDNTEG